MLSGWGEFIAMNSSGRTAFRAAVSGLLSDDDEGGSGIFLAGPGAGALTKIATTGTTIGGRYTCGFSSIVGMNDSGQVIFDGLTLAPGSAWLPNHAYALNVFVTPTPPNGLAYRVFIAGTSGGSQPVFPTSLGATIVDGTVTWRAERPSFGATRCDEEKHALIRYSSGPGNELLVTLGSSVGGSTVVGFGNDVDNATSTTNCSACIYNDIDGLINSAGHVPVVLRLADATQGVYNFSAPGVSTEVARTGGANPYTALSPRASINNSDQVAFKGTSRPRLARLPVHAPVDDGHRRFGRGRPRNAKRRTPERPDLHELRKLLRPERLGQPGFPGQGLRRPGGLLLLERWNRSGQGGLPEGRHEQPGLRDDHAERRQSGRVRHGLGG